LRIHYWIITVLLSFTVINCGKRDQSFVMPMRETAFRYSLSVLKIYSVRYVYYRFLVPNIGTQRKTFDAEYTLAMTTHLAACSWTRRLRMQGLDFLSLLSVPSDFLGVKIKDWLVSNSDDIKKNASANNPEARRIGNEMVSSSVFLA